MGRENYPRIIICLMKRGGSGERKLSQNYHLLDEERWGVGRENYPRIIICLMKRGGEWGERIISELSFA